MPSVLGIMPTRGLARHEWAKQAVQSFVDQDYLEKTLIIIDDKDDPTFPNPHELPFGVGYVLAPERYSIGKKRNLACEIASERGAVYIAHFDSDDHSAPTRLSVQIQLLHSSGKALCGFDSLIFYDVRTQRAGRWTDAGNCCGTSMVYRRDWWETHRFPEVTKDPWGEDNAFRDMAQDEKQLISIRGDGLIVARAHTGNTNGKHMNGFTPIHVNALPKGFHR